MDTDKFMTKLFNHDVFVDLTLLDILLAKIISIYNKLGPVITVENIFSKNLQKFAKIYEHYLKMTIKGNNSLRSKLTILVMLIYL